MPAMLPGMMFENVQTAFASVHGPGSIALGPVARVVSAGDRRGVARWSGYRFPTWTMVWSGTAGYLARRHDGREVARAPRTWALHGPDSPFGERLDCAPRESLYLFFTASGAFAPLAGRPLTIVRDDDGAIAERVRAMAAAQARGGPGDALAAHGALLAVLGAIAAGGYAGAAGDDDDPWRPRAADDAAPANALLAAVDALVLRDPARPPSRARIALALGMSESSLAHRFRRETGVTLVGRIRWLRVREAMARLREPDASVKSVARALGFRSASWFSRVFQQVAGTPPQRYRAGGRRS